jgi:hypothetical protein
MILKFIIELLIRNKNFGLSFQLLKIINVVSPIIFILILPITNLWLI